MFGVIRSGRFRPFVRYQLCPGFGNITYGRNACCFWIGCYDAGASDRGGKGLNRLSLSADDLVMAMHKASSRRIEVLSRTTGDVDEVGSIAELRPP